MNEHHMEEWTEEEWGNLEIQANNLIRLLRDPHLANRAWRAKLRIAIHNIGMFDGSVEKAQEPIPRLKFPVDHD